MTGLREPLAGYLELRRSVGFSLEREEKLLGQFITWLEDRRAATITTADALAWVTMPAGASAGWLKMRMQAVRGFAAYLATLDPARAPGCCITTSARRSPGWPGRPG
jgi:hypothetical protein